MLLFLWARVHWPVRALEVTGPAALRDLAFTLILWSLILILCFSLGGFLFRLFHFERLENLERDVFTFALGFGAVSYWILLLALLQLLNPLALAISLIAAAILVAPEATDFVGRIAALPGSVHQAWGNTSTTGKVVLSIILVIAGFGFINALTPAWDYDGLMYHLVGPKLFLEAGRIFPFPDNWYVNGPFTIEMVFSLGLAFRDDVLPKLIHFSLATLYILTSYFLAKRLLNREGAWLSVALIMGIPTLPILAGFAYIDLGWSAFEVLALLAFVIWFQDKDSRWLLLSGLMCGLAMGSKYVGLMGFGLLGLVILAIDLRSGWRKLIKTILVFSVPAVLVASPWYLKNIIWFTNPVYPLYFGGPGWSEQRLDLYDAYLQVFGYGRSLIDSLLLPINIFIHNTRFGAVMNQIEIPNPLYLLVFGYPFLPKKRLLSILAMIAGGRFILWAIGSQQTRFLLPVFPSLSILTAYVLQRLFNGRGNLGRFHYVPRVLCITLMGITLYYQLIYTAKFWAGRTIVGEESRETYLMRIVRDYPMIDYVKTHLSDEDQVLFLGDGRGYYCVPQCIPDPDHFRWAGEISVLDSYSELGDWFSEQHLKYLALSWEDLDFLLQHDPRGVMAESVRRLSAWRKDGCLDEIFRDEWVSLFEIKCATVGTPGLSDP